jgi:hypothetical protein
MGTPKITQLAVLAVSLAAAFLMPVTPSRGDICSAIREDHCTVRPQEQAISIVKRDLRGKKYAKSVARLIGRPICARIVNTFAYSPVRPQLRGWQMKLRTGGWRPLYSCRL